jgi:hypothetical protein
VRVNVWLTDLQTARDIWSDRFDGDRTNLAVLQDNITARLLCVAHLHLRQYKEALEPCSLHESDLGLRVDGEMKKHAKAPLHTTHNFTAALSPDFLSMLKQSEYRR